MIIKEKEFFDFVFERQLLWYNRFCLNKPSCSWTSNLTLKTYKFCNCYRELDKGTKYIIEKLKNIKDRKVIFQNIVFYRFFNKFHLYEELNIQIIKKWDYQTTQQLISKFDSLRQKTSIFNDAYLISGNKTKEPKHVFIIKNLERYFNKYLKKQITDIDNSNTPEESIAIIKSIPQVGDFLAYEIWTDLTYFDFFKQKWTDNDFVNIGPGAKWGLELIYGKRLNKTTQLEKLNYLYKHQKEYLDKIRKNNLFWRDINYQDGFTNSPYLSLRNIEHSLCEFRKYLRLKKGKGKKRYYK